MNYRTDERPKILFLFSDTGGGHRSAAEAIIEALNLEFPGQIETEMVDIFRHAPPPLHLAIPTYPIFAQMPSIWEIGYTFLDGRKRVIVANSVLTPYVRQYYKRLLEEHPCQMIVSVHPIPNAAFLENREQGESPNLPYIIVVTDLVTTPAFWYDSRADKIILPTEQARQRGLKLGADGSKMEVVGLPVADRFCNLPKDRAALREKLGWPKDLPMILVVGGGEGMGPMGKNVLAINAAHLPAGMAVVCGRNKRLRQRLDEQVWNSPTFVYGFVKDMPELMAAADLIVTKAGPGTISEAFIAGLPIILYNRMPGQEDGNVAYVVEEGAGVYAPQPKKVVAALEDYLAQPELRRRAAESSRRLARPQASRYIARMLGEKLGIPVSKA